MNVIVSFRKIIIASTYSDESLRESYRAQTAFALIYTASNQNEKGADSLDVSKISK